MLIAQALISFIDFGAGIAWPTSTMMIRSYSKGRFNMKLYAIFGLFLIAAGGAFVVHSAAEDSGVQLTCADIRDNQPKNLPEAYASINQALPASLQRTENAQLGIPVLLQMECTRGDQQTVGEIAPRIAALLQHQVEEAREAARGR
jgi:hypothetical protein